LECGSPLAALCRFANASLATPKAAEGRRTCIFLIVWLGVPEKEGQPRNPPPGCNRAADGARVNFRTRHTLLA